MQAIAGLYEITRLNELNLKDFGVGLRTVQFDLSSGQAFDFIGFDRVPGNCNAATITSNRGGNIPFSHSNPVDFSGPEWRNLSWIQVSASSISECQFHSFTFQVTDDDDHDGVPNDPDECPNSDLSATAVIDGCNSGVPNTLFPSGYTISDFIAACSDGASNHGQFVSCVSHMTNDLKKAGTITGQQKDAIQSCAGRADIP